VFSGQAAQLVYQGLDFGRLSWQVRPAQLLLGHVEFHVELTDPANPGHANITITPRGNVYGRDVELMLSPDRLVNHYSPMPVRTSGAIQLQIDTFRVAGGFPQDVSGLLSWEDAVVLEPIELILGDVGMTLHSQEDLLAGSITRGGRLEAAGDIELFADGRYRLDLRILPDNTMSEETLAAIEMAGQVQPDSSLLFNAAGRL